MCSLIEKYNVAGPRYTSYPTVPYWDKTSFSGRKWQETVVKSLSNTNTTEGISVYIHLPYCESLCTFCGCTKRITKNHSVESPYIESVIKEWQLYLKLFEQKPIVKQLHLGGGTPTFFSAENLSFLIREIFTNAIKAPDCEMSFEGHPNNNTTEHLETLNQLGFKRVCFGVQDYNLKVQKAIHRIQPLENVVAATQNARLAGYTSVGHDLVYGLPFQDIDDVVNTINNTIALAPDRIAWYSYAHVPWLKGNGQRGYDDADLPTATQKAAQYQMGKQMLLDAGYAEIGMDHFALATDSLYSAQKNGNLHRNFMGYTESKTQLMVGLGASAISDSWFGFAQNDKNIEAYMDLVGQNILPVSRGHILTSEDLIIRQHILNLMCQFETHWGHDLQFKDVRLVIEALQPMLADGLINLTPNGLQITSKGHPFVRNVCLAFDRRLQKNQPQQPLFSMTV